MGYRFQNILRKCIFNIDFIICLLTCILTMCNFHDYNEQNSISGKHCSYNNSEKFINKRNEAGKNEEHLILDNYGRDLKGSGSKLVEVLEDLLNSKNGAQKSKHIKAINDISHKIKIKINKIENLSIFKKYKSKYIDKYRNKISYEVTNDKGCILKNFKYNKHSTHTKNGFKIVNKISHAGSKNSNSNQSHLKDIKKDLKHLKESMITLKRNDLSFVKNHKQIIDNHSSISKNISSLDATNKKIKSYHKQIMETKKEANKGVQIIKYHSKKMRTHSYWILALHAALFVAAFLIVILI